MTPDMITDNLSRAQDIIKAITAERDALRGEVERLRYVLEGVRGAILTGRNEPLVIWREQIEIALDACSAQGGQDTPSVAEAAKVLLKARMKDSHIEAAMVGHYGERSRKLTIDGLDMTSNDKNWSFKAGFKRMLRAYLRALAKGQRND